LRAPLRPCPASSASSVRVWLIATPIFSLAPICGPRLPSSASEFRILKALSLLLQILYCVLLTLVRHHLFSTHFLRGRLDYRNYPESAVLSAVIIVLLFGSMSLYQFVVGRLTQGIFGV
jgi:hypothetical protein